MTLKLGIIGMSEGNGHPYSWSAIMNGYCTEAMSGCEFPVIPEYLSRQTWPDARIPNVEVSHIWTQSREVSNRIAQACMIKNVVGAAEEMIGSVDGLLLARDDAENHLLYAKPFLKAGIPIYIDKPIALSLHEMDAIYDMQQYDGQIFTCSALRFSEDLVMKPSDRSAVGNIKFIQAVTPKSWNKYAIHIIEPVLNMLSEYTNIMHLKASQYGTQARGLDVEFENGVITQFIAMEKLASPISIRVYGDKGWRDLHFSDSFQCFKSALKSFVNGVLTKSCNSPYSYNKKVVTLIEAGRANV